MQITRFLFLCFAVLGSTFTAAGADQSEAVGIYALHATPLNNAPEFETLADETTLIILFQPDCPWCGFQFRDAEAFRRNRAPFVQLAAVSRNGSLPDLLNELRKYQTDIPAWQSSPELLEALGETPGTPCVYLVRPEGEVARHRCGRQTSDELVRFLMGR